MENRDGYYYRAIRTKLGTRRGRKTTFCRTRLQRHCLSFTSWSALLGMRARTPSRLAE
jgi:hypothetical protein